MTIPATSGSTYPIGIFTSAALSDPAQGIDYEVLTFTFNDTQSSFPLTPFTVYYEVIKINNAPTIALGGVIADQHTASAQLNQSYTGVFDVEDTDAEFGIETLTISLDNSKAPDSFIDTTNMAGFQVVASSDTLVTFSGTLAQIQSIASAVTIAPPSQPSSGTVSAVLTITVNDNGNTGQCPTDTTLTSSNCPLSTTTAVVISWVKPSDNRAAMIGGSAAAAGFAGLIAIAAGVLFKKMNSKASEGYQPWDDGSIDEAVAENPLYVGSGLSGENPLFESNTNAAL